MTRTDQHRLASADFDPSDYRLLAYEILESRENGGDDFEWIEDRFHGLDTRDNSTDDAFIELRHSLAKRDRAAVEDGWRRCSLCGHGRSHTWAYFEHVPTGEVVTVGHICAGKFKLENRADVLELLKARAEGRKLAALRGRILNGDPASRRAIDICVAELVRIEERLAGERDDDTEPADHFLLDVARRFYREPFTLSEKQLRALLKVPAKRAERLARQAKWAEQEAEAEPVPVTDERMQIEGEVIKVDFKEDDFGGRFVMTVKDDRGFAVWGTKPEAADGAILGTRIRFMARVERSDRSETFGFFKRPTKVEILESSNVEDSEHQAVLA